MPDQWFMLVPALIILALVGTAVFQWLWNTTMPEAFGLREIRFWVAFRLLIIATLLTSGGLVQLRAG